MKKKKLLLGFTLLLVLTACGDRQTEGDTKGAGADEPKTIILGTSADYAPYEFHKTIDGKDTIVGFDIALAKEIAKDMNAELKIADMDFDGLLLALKTGKVDMVISGMTPSEERKKSVDFSDLYYLAEQAVLVRKDEAAKYQALGDLKGKKVGVQKSSIQEGIGQGIEGAKLTSLTKIPELILELTSRRADALILEKPVADQYVKTQKGIVVSDVKIVQSEDEGGSAIAIKKGNQALVDQVNATIKRLKENGDINRFVIEANELIGE